MSIKNKNNPELEKIIKGCRKNKISAQRLLYEQFYGFAMNICLRYGSSQSQAEEIVNDVFLKVFKSINSYKDEYNFHGWFKTITIRTCIDYYRRYNTKVVLIDIEETPFLEYEQGDAVSRLSAQEILDLVHKLPPAYRTVFSLYVIDGYSHAEIAEMLEINEGTSRSNLAKARYKLQDWIRIYLNDKITKY